MAPSKRVGQQTASRSDATDSGRDQQNRGAKGHAETPTPRTGGAAGEDAGEDDLLAATDDTDESPSDAELEALEVLERRGGALRHEQLDVRGDEESGAPRAIDLEVTEPQGDVDLLTNAIRDASLFDQPSEEGDPHAPRIAADETVARDEHEGTSATNASAREVEKQRERAKLRKTREHDEPARPKRSNNAR
jgi:hypothetical protein